MMHDTGRRLVYNRETGKILHHPCSLSPENGNQLHLVNMVRSNLFFRIEAERLSLPPEPGWMIYPVWSYVAPDPAHGIFCNSSESLHSQFQMGWGHVSVDGQWTSVAYHFQAIEMVEAHGGQIAFALVGPAYRPVRPVLPPYRPPAPHVPPQTQLLLPLEDEC